MMLVYYVYALPLSLKIGRGFYEDGIWTDGGFMPYSNIGGLTWREGEQPTLVLLYRWRDVRAPADRARALLRRRRGGCCATRSPRTTFISPGRRSTWAPTTSVTTSKE